MPLEGRKAIRTRFHAPAFSLMELMLVVCLLVILSALAAPRYANSQACYRADMAAKRIAADLTMARGSAWSAGAHRTVTFTPASNSYVMADIRGLDTAAADYVVTLADDPYCARIVSAGFEGQTAVVFDGYGMPDRGGQVVIQVGAFRKTILLDRDSGNASVQ